jgi:hypothetical protein
MIGQALTTGRTHLDKAMQVILQSDLAELERIPIELTHQRSSADSRAIGNPGLLGAPRLWPGSPLPEDERMTGADTIPSDLA